MSITLHQLAPIAPIIITSTTALVVMLTIAIKRSHAATAGLTLLGLGVATISALQLMQAGTSAPVTPLLVVDSYALFFMVVILLATMACVALARAYLESRSDHPEEFYLLILVAATGGLILTASVHLASLFIGVELLAVPLYGLIAYRRGSALALEAGIKYLVLSATASAFLLFGMALVYAATGTLVAQQLLTEINADATLTLAGAAMMLVGVAFKLSLAPFHLWTPDVYEGAPAPVGAFLATVSKVAMFAVFLRWLLAIPLEGAVLLRDLLAVISVLSILVGNLLALNQTNLKRILGYSSIAHFGYLLVAVLANREAILETVIIYLVIYTTASLGAFGVVALVSNPERSRDADTPADYRGLSRHHPVLATVLGLMLLSLAGIPLTAGFIAKFYVFTTAVQMQLWVLLGAVVIGSTLGVFYYLRAIVAIFQRPEAAVGRPHARYHLRPSTGGAVVLALFAVTLGLGLYPQPLMDLLATLLTTGKV